MIRSFTYLNFSLVLLLAGVCTFQWRKERDYGTRLGALQQTSDAQHDKLTAQSEELRRVNEDLDGFRQTVSSHKTESDAQLATIREQKAQLFQLGTEKETLSKQVVAWQQAVEQHKTALAQRDQNLKTLLQQREQILAANKDAASKANEAIQAYNTLAAKYQDVVQRYNTLASQYQAEKDPARARPN